MSSLRTESPDRASHASDAVPRVTVIVCLGLLSGLLVVRAARSDEAPFARANANDQGGVDISDAITTLLHLFDDLPLPCEKAADANDDGRLDVSDAISTLSFLFASAPPFAPPFPDCGLDTTPDQLTCEEYRSCPPPAPIVSIAAFNVENLSQSEFAKSHVRINVARVVREFDLVAVQEIRDSEEIVAEQLLDVVNAAADDDPDLPTYAMVESPRLGGSEQYAIYYKTDLFDHLGSHVHPDPDDSFARGVLVSSFRSGDFDFTLLTIHANHVETAAELAALPAVFDDLLESQPTERDLILIGDLNADCRSFDENDSSHPLRASRFRWLIPNSADTIVHTGQHCARDRIVLVSETFDHEYVPMSAGVFLFDHTYGLSDSVARDVSDHYPVFARFDVTRGDDD